MDEDQEKNNKVAGLVTSVGVHVVLIILFLFVMGFTAPNPPLGELGSGVELQLGVDDSGSGDVQQDIPVTPTDATNVSDGEPPKQEPNVDEQIKEEAAALPEKTKEDLTTDEKESPVIEKEVSKEPKKVEPPKEKIIAKPKDVPTTENHKEQKKEIKKEITEPVTGKTDGSGAVKNQKGISQGNDKGTTGDKGSPQGVPDLKAQYSGKPGTGGAGDGGNGGISVSGFDGYVIPDITKPAIPEDSYGIYEFQVTVNSAGEIDRITTTKKGSSLAAEAIFRNLIEKLDFTPNKENLPPSSKGRITFNVVSKQK